MFKQNIDTTGRIFRFVIALGRSFLAYYYMSWILLALSLFCLFEVFMGWCAFYQLIGKNSCPTKK